MTTLRASREGATKLYLLPIKQSFSENMIQVRTHAWLCQVKAESGTIDGWNHFIEATAFRLKSSVTLSGCTTGSP